jgi:tRNA (guanine-N(7)-)-methyltransferase
MNPYAARLNEFPDIAFNAEGNFVHHGKWASFFQNKIGHKPKRLVFEIGCSNGLFLCQAAASHPDWAFVGIDWKFKVLYRAAKRAATAGLKNVAFLRGKAQELPQIFDPAELDEIYLFFPDPWAKTTQLKHRLMQEGFLSEAARVLRAGGTLHFKTDHPGYFQWVLALFGYPQPDLQSYDHPDPAEKSKRARQVKVRKLMRREDLPKASVAVQEQFKVVGVSTNFWQLEGGLGQLQGQPYERHRTFFEGLFIGEELPIYYIQIQRK